MNSRVRYLLISLMVIAVAPGQLVHGQAEEGAKSPAGSILWHYVGRITVNVTSGKADIYGYFTTIAGVPGALFDGAPSETTAFFTFRAQGTVQPLPANGDVRVTLIEPGSISVYFTAVPNHDWAHPDSFSSGISLATFARAKAVEVQVGGVIEEAHTATLVSSHDFNFNDLTLDFASLAPRGVTDKALGSATPLSSSAFPLLSFPFAGNGIAIADTQPPH